MPLKPELVYEEALRYIDAGVKQLILPKPVVMNQAQLHALIDRVADERVKAAVASQWCYSDVPQIIRREIERVSADQRAGRVQRVEIEFSKEHGLAYGTAPPLLELPHVLQLLSSIGLIDVAHDTPEVVGTRRWWPSRIVRNTSSTGCMCGPASITSRRRVRNAVRRIGITRSER